MQASATMATTNTKAIVSPRAILLILILIDMASVQVCGDNIPPPPILVPPPSVRGGRCMLNDEVAFAVCVDLRLGTTSPSGMDMCCRWIHGMPSAVDCLCSAFKRADIHVSASVADDINVVLAVCGKALVPDLNCFHGSG
ncbi:hypothetical protein CFC21_013144 [Triticum aestivum]|uniref:Bifunctional inhibitor/plant lipid transfer protein/seed storage helical domain-containing protein n=2 Tax=Triticum aestivum TaxID=4565 RepID=A0A9R1DRI4_WHEAT|nr:hypothetical protein CFC21_013143 [Triticum aestivum]KAF6996854.1 hypothetical protein CFC21_013144 [Triticum aestivum]